MKKVFLAVTEQGRKKGRISFYIAEITQEKGMRLIDNDYTVSSGSHKGIEAEVLARLVYHNELPSEALNEQGYMNAKYSENYHLIIFQGTGLNYLHTCI